MDVAGGRERKSWGDVGRQERDAWLSATPTAVWRMNANGEEPCCSLTSSDTTTIVRSSLVPTIRLCSLCPSLHYDIHRHH